MRVQRCILAAIAVAVVTAIPCVARGSDARELIDDARRYVERGRFDDAEGALERAVDKAYGATRREAWFLLAGLQRDTGEANALYERVIDDDPDGEWSKRAHLELAKVQYALGNYNEAFNLLDNSDACDVSDEACLFHGLSAIMLKRYREAERPLSRIRRGRLQTWALISLAEADMKLERKGEACERYESLSSALISPTAIYRYAECLEDRGDVDGARREYREIIRSFRDTPEAVLAAEKLQVIVDPAGEGSGRATAPPHPDESAGSVVLESGFTLQFGSFRDRGNAIKLAAKIKRVFPGARIDSELVRYREYHRVRYGYFRTREEAQAKGDEIERQIGEGYTIMRIP